MKILVCDKCRETKSEPIRHDHAQPKDWRQIHLSDNFGGRLTLNICPNCVEGTHLRDPSASRPPGWKDTFCEFVFECIDAHADQRAGV